MTFGFNGDFAVIDMQRKAEDFLNEYSGYVTGKKQQL